MPLADRVAQARSPDLQPLCPRRPAATGAPEHAAGVAGAGLWGRRRPAAAADLRGLVHLRELSVMGDTRVPAGQGAATRWFKAMTALQLPPGLTVCPLSLRRAGCPHQ